MIQNDSPVNFDHFTPIGDINFNIGHDNIDGFGENELAMVREEEELSAVYLRPNNCSANAVESNQAVEGSNQAVTIENETTKRHPSVRYVVNPAQRIRQRTISLQSDFSSGQVVGTDMTTLPEEDEEENDPSKPIVERSVSIMSKSSQHGPGWRSNVRGDYDPTNIKPIATKDLLSWAYQVSLIM